MDCLKWNMFAGGISGLIEVTTTHPIDLLKTRMQSNQTKYLGNPIQYIYSFYKNEGIFGLYRGYIPRVLGVIPLRIIFWGSQETSNLFLKDYFDNDSYRFIISGILAGSFQSLLDVPIENLKVRMMTSNSSNHHIYKNLFAGFSPNLFRNIGFTVSLNYFIHKDNDYSNQTENFFRAATGAMIGSILTQPLDYIKTQLQVTEPLYLNAKQIILNTPYHYYFTGTFSRAIMSFINMGIGYSVFYQIKKWCYNSV